MNRSPLTAHPQRSPSRHPRHYRSTSVSYGLGWGLLGLGTRGIWGLLVLPFAVMWLMLLAELWLCAEFLLLVVTGLAVIVALARREAKAGDVTVMSLRWHLHMFGLKGARR